MNLTVEQVLKMPTAVLFERKVKAALEAEQKKRRHFYEIADENKKMEFINGEIIFHSSDTFHQNKAVGNILLLLDTFVIKNELGFVGIEKIMISLTRNDYEPDVCFFGNENAVKFTSKQMRFPAPDFVVEVLSDSTEKSDRETKFQDYAAHGVGEYWIIDAEKETIEQYLLHGEQYELFLKSNSGEIQSRVLQGFIIPIRSVFDEKANIEALTQILNG